MLAQRHKGAKMERDDELERLARIAVDCGYHIHADLGPGLLESVYQELVCVCLRQQGLFVEAEVLVPVSYKGVTIDKGFRADILVERRLLIELKSTEGHSPVHAKQLLTYLRLMQLPLGLLINFGMTTYREGLRRIGNNYFAPKQ